MDFPRRMRDVTPEWLTQALQESGALRGTVKGFELDPIGNFSNQLWRIHLECDSPADRAPRTVVLKRLKRGSPEDASQELADEIRFYREFSAELPVHTPRLYFGASEQDHAVLLMEHMEGFVALDWWTGASAEHSRLALEGLAELHAHQQGRVAERDWIPSFADDSHLEREAARYDADWGAKREFFAEHAPAFVEIGDALVGRLAASLSGLGQPETLLHGDAHFENLALVEDRAGNSSILFHDWAGVRRGAGVFDLAVFLVMSFPPERRRSVERHLVSLYADALHSAGGREALDPWQGYRLGVLAWAVRMVHFMQPFPPGGTPAHGPGLMVLERCAAAPVELNVGDLIA
jgi:aminoglycoside/choline kinase family phosphotransferase